MSISSLGSIPHAGSRAESASSTAESPARQACGGGLHVDAAQDSGPAHARLRALAYELTVAEARERARIAAGLHDDIGQTLALLGRQLHEARCALPLDHPAHVALEEARTLLRHATAATRTATFELCNPVLRQLGFRAALESVVAQLARGGGTPINLRGDVRSLPLPEPAQAVLLRVARELMFNAQKHARASAVTVLLQVSGQLLRVCVQDDGCGLRPQETAQRFSPEGGYGLVTAEAQMQAIGGTLEIDTAPGRGMRVTLALPLPARR